MKNLYIKTLYFITFILIYKCTNIEEDKESISPTKYTLTVTSGEGGSVTPDASGTYNKGATITITATPNNGYVFDKWVGSDNDNSNCNFSGPLGCRTGITMNSNRYVDVFFKRKVE